MDVTIEDLRRRARRRLPRAVFDFIDGAAEDEVSLGWNAAAFDRWAFVPRVLVDVSEVDLATEILGERLATPLILAPTGLCGMAAPRGEIAVARAAARLGVPFVASCLSAVTLEDIAREAPGAHWFQLYLWKDRGLTRSLAERAARAGYRVLVVTVDVPVLGQRERDLRNGATVPPKITLANAWDTLRRPAWMMGMLRNPRIEFANVATPGASAGRPFALSQYINTQFDASVTWKDLEWLRSAWSGPIILKGILSADDARRAHESGFEGIVVSNHGGRQLDQACASLDALPEIAAAVATRMTVLFDGGIRRGADVAIAIALGARGCMVGRPYLYGLAAAGQVGVERSLEILLAETKRTLALVGRPRLADLNRTALRRANYLSGGNDERTT